MKLMIKKLNLVIWEVEEISDHKKQEIMIREK